MASAFNILRLRSWQLSLAAIGAGTTTYLLFPKAEMKTEKKTKTKSAEKITPNTEEVSKLLHEAYAKLNGLEGVKCNSLLKKYFTKDVLEKNKNKRTKLGASLYDCIRSGVYNLNTGIGVYAPDTESYTVFADLFDKIIEDYHGFSPKQKQPPVDFGEDRCKKLKPLDPQGKYIKLTRIHCCRSLADFPFNPLLKAADYVTLEAKVKQSLESIKDKELKGTYYPLQSMTKETQAKLIADHFLFKEGNRNLQHANVYNFWPKGRGIFLNNNKNFLVWVNEEDHLRIISMQNGSDVGNVLDRLIRGVKAIEATIPFSRNPRLGFLTFCPTNLGSTIRASVHIKLPKVSARKDFKQICDKLNLHVRGTYGEYSESDGSIFDISNKQSLGISEYQAVCQMYDGVKKLIELEETV